MCLCSACVFEDREGQCLSTFVVIVVGRRSVPPVLCGVQGLSKDCHGEYIQLLIFLMLVSMTMYCNTIP